ncbi:MAG: hypothetical protein AB7R69_00810 [Candidatus Babeliales bacterium]
MTLYDNVRDLFLGFAFALLIPFTFFYGMHYAGYDCSTDFAFYIILAAGILFIILGAFLKLGFIGGGSILGGVFTIVYGYLCVWHKITVGIKFATLLGALGVIIALALFLKRKS